LFWNLRREFRGREERRRGRRSDGFGIVWEV
jgi:hypothetical protein